MSATLGELILGGAAYAPHIPATGYTFAAAPTRRGGVTVTVYQTGRTYAIGQREFAVTSSDLAMALALAGREIARRSA